MKNFTKCFLGLSLLPCLIFGASEDKANKKLPPSEYAEPVYGNPSQCTLPKQTVDIIFDAEFLWWYSTVSNMPYLTTKQLSVLGSNDPNNNSIINPKSMTEFDWKWDPGMRLGFGVLTNHDGWDVYTNWTYFYNSGSNSKTVPAFNDTQTANAAGTDFLSSPWFRNGSQNDFDRVSGRWALLFNQIDLELGRKFWLSKWLTMRPFGGLRGHWSRLFLRTHGTATPTGNSNTSLTDESANLKQRFWAIGLVFGAKTAWHMTTNWSVFGESDASLLYGPRNLRAIYKLRQLNSDGASNSNFQVNYKHDDIFGLQAVFDLAIGFRWETLLYKDAFRLNFDAGWENHIWINFNKLDENLSNQSFASANGDLTLSGLVIRGRFEF